MKIWMREILQRAYNAILNLGRIQLLLKVSRGRVTLSTLRTPPSYVSEYYNYCVDGIVKAIENKSNNRLAVFLSNQSFHFCRETKTVFVNTEHTLVRKNGRDSVGSRLGTVPVVGSEQIEKYLVRIPGGASNMATADQVVDYSIPNTLNVLQSSHKHLYLNKSHVIAPLLSPVMLNTSWEGRDLEKIFTLMSLPESGDRRSEIVEELKDRGLDMVNISGLVGDISERMSRIGTLINLHQTEHHHTLEELRILPALLQGVLVVSEPAPLTDQVPYSKFINFASIEEMPDVISRLMDNYEENWEKTFATGEFTKVVAELEESNRKAFKELVHNLKL